MYICTYAFHYTAAINNHAVNQICSCPRATCWSVHTCDLPPYCHRLLAGIACSTPNGCFTGCSHTRTTTIATTTDVAVELWACSVIVPGTFSAVPAGWIGQDLRTQSLQSVGHVIWRVPLVCCVGRRRLVFSFWARPDSDSPVLVGSIANLLVDDSGTNPPCNGLGMSLLGRC